MSKVIYYPLPKERINKLISIKKGINKLKELSEMESNNITLKVIKGNSKKLLEIWKENNFPTIDFCITSPPYWNQLKRNHIRQKERKEKGYDTIYGNEKEEIGNIDNYKDFISEQKKIFDNVYEIMKDGGYLIVITNNIYTNGKLYPLAFDTLISLSEKWIPKDEKIWCQEDKALLPLGINSAYIGNRHHQYCLIFRKEIKERNGGEV